MVRSSLLHFEVETEQKNYTDAMQHPTLVRLGAAALAQKACAHCAVLWDKAAGWHSVLLDRQLTCARP